MIGPWIGQLVKSEDVMHSVYHVLATIIHDPSFDLVVKLTALSTIKVVERILIT